MNALIQILDYGSGNLFSIKESLRRAAPDLRVVISSNYKKGSVEGVILPGVGNFSSAQRILTKNKETSLADVSERRLPILGICLGMQLLFQESEEGPGSGLGLFSGKVVRFNHTSGVKVPHMGWDRVNLVPRATKKREFFAGLSKQGWGYFAHSYFADRVRDEFVMASTEYGGREFASIIQNENVVGTQFHPEKSADFGFQIISSFVQRVQSLQGK